MRRATATNRSDLELTRYSTRCPYCPARKLVASIGSIMREFYKTRDTRLDWIVAVKIEHTHFSPERYGVTPTLTFLSSSLRARNTPRYHKTNRERPRCSTSSSAIAMPISQACGRSCKRCAIAAWLCGWTRAALRISRASRRASRLGSIGPRCFLPGSRRGIRNLWPANESSPEPSRAVRQKAIRAAGSFSSTRKRRIFTSTRLSSATHSTSQRPIMMPH